MFWYVFSSIAFGLAGLLIYLYFERQGQFDDLEDVKYQMFREDNEKIRAETLNEKKNKMEEQE